MRILLTIMALALCWLGGIALAMPAVMPLSEVRDGMSGTLYTVADSSGTLSSFPVSIKGVLQNGATMPYILARSEGSFADTDGGLMQGMSGSPVYVDGRLIGAASATLNEMNPHTFLITPIEEMLPLWELPDTQARAEEAYDLRQHAREAERSRQKWQKAIDRLHPKPEPKRNEQRGKQPPAALDKPKELPSAGNEPRYKMSLFAGGFGREGLGYLARQLQPLGCEVRPQWAGAVGGGTSATVDYGASLEAGGAVGVALVYGDFTLGATGTVTAVDGQRILAFGHPFLHKGNVNYFMTDARVHAMVNGVSNGMKIASTTSIIGRVNQDRESGIAGIVGRFPAVVPMRLTVMDATLKRERQYTAQVAYNEVFVPALAPAISYAALRRTVNTTGESTVNVNFSIKTDALDGGTLERQNMFYASADTGQIAFGELAQALGIICGNKESESDLLDVKVHVQSVAGRKTATLISAVADKARVQPGETVKFQVRLKPYRAKELTVTVPYTVPKHQPDGQMTLDIHGGALVRVEQILAAMQAQAGMAKADEPPLPTVQEQLQQFLERASNNDIVIEPGAMPALTEKEQERHIRRAAKRWAQVAEEEESAAGQGGRDKEKRSRDKAAMSKQPTDYVIDNLIHSTVTVGSAKN